MMFVIAIGDPGCIHEWKFKNNVQHCHKCDRMEAYYIQSQFPFG